MILEDLDRDAQELLYNSMKNSVIDVASMDPAGIAEMKRFVYEFGETGDKLRVNVSFDDQNQKKFLTEAVFVKDGHSLPDLETNVFLPFEGLTDPSGITISSSTLGFREGKVVVDGKLVEFGSHVMVGGRRVVLARGSVVLVLDDTLVKGFPERGVEGEIVTNDGTLAVGDVTASGIFMVEKQDVDVVSYVFNHDEHTDQRTCVYRRTHRVDFSEQSGYSIVDLGYYGGTLESVLGYNSSSVDISSVSEDGRRTKTSIDTRGILFDSNDSAVMFGDFRLRYDQNTDSVQIQHLQQSSGEYVTKREFGR